MNKLFKDHFSTHAHELDNLKYSTDTKDYCKTVCMICGMEMYLMRMRGHTKDKHDISITDYKLKFNIKVFKVISKVFHKCGLCSEIMLLDADTIGTHLDKHDMTHKEYNETYMTMMNRKNGEGEAKKTKV